ncbi:hypothetical protein L1887_30997 [Cichorium endivia]|nr:hypothetical protein L1887_30997 [Cichorium endivia]
MAAHNSSHMRVLICPSSSLLSLLPQPQLFHLPPDVIYQPPPASSLPHTSLFLSFASNEIKVGARNKGVGGKARGVEPLRNEDTSRTGVPVVGNEIPFNELYNQCAIYIAAAHALKTNYSVYASAFKLVRTMLPLPYLYVGHLTVPPLGNPVDPHCDWKRFQFVLNHEALQQIHDDEQNHVSGDNNEASIIVEILNIVSVKECSNLTLPPGPSFSIDTIRGPFFLVLPIFFLAN